MMSEEGFPNFFSESTQPYRFAIVFFSSDDNRLHIEAEDLDDGQFYYLVFLDLKYFSGPIGWVATNFTMYSGEKNLYDIMRNTNIEFINKLLKAGYSMYTAKGETSLTIIVASTVSLSKERTWYR